MWETQIISCLKGQYFVCDGFRSFWIALCLLLWNYLLTLKRIAKPLLKITFSVINRCSPVNSHCMQWKSAKIYLSQPAFCIVFQDHWLNSVWSSRITAWILYDLPGSLAELWSSRITGWILYDLPGSLAEFCVIFQDHWLNSVWSSRITGCYLYDLTGSLAAFFMIFQNHWLLSVWSSRITGWFLYDLPGSLALWSYRITGFFLYDLPGSLAPFLYDLPGSLDAFWMIFQDHWLLFCVHFHCQDSCFIFPEEEYTGRIFGISKFMISLKQSKQKCWLRF
jgi:hypothetical protein